MSRLDPTQERLIETYRKKAKHYNFVSRLYPVPGYPQQAQRRRAVRALGLRPGCTVVDIACGTGQNFPMIEQAIGPDGRIIGVDLTDAADPVSQQLFLSLTNYMGGPNFAPAVESTESQIKALIA